MPRVPGGQRWLPAVLLAGVAAVVAAATMTPWRVADRFGVFTGVPTRPPAPSASPSASRPTPAGTPTDERLGQVLGVGFWVLAVLAAVALVVFLWRVVPRRRAVPTQVPGAAVVGVPADIEPDPPVLRAGVAEALDALGQASSPADAVVAAWVALESAAGRSGVPRQPADTPTELTGRVLAATDADAEAVRGLLRLYHRARFSTEGVDDADVEQARGHLTALAASWDRFVR